MNSGELLEGAVVNFNKGGVIVNVHGVDCFVPISQLVNKNQNDESDINNNVEIKQHGLEKGDVISVSY